MGGRVRKQAVLADGVQVATNARVGRGVSLGYGAVVDDGASVSANAVVAPCTRVQSSDRDVPKERRPLGEEVQAQTSRELRQSDPSACGASAPA